MGLILLKFNSNPKIQKLAICNPPHKLKKTRSEEEGLEADSDCDEPRNRRRRVGRQSWTGCVWVLCFAICDLWMGFSLLCCVLCLGFRFSKKKILNEIPQNDDVYGRNRSTSVWPTRPPKRRLSDLLRLGGDCTISAYSGRLHWNRSGWAPTSD